MNEEEIDWAVFKYDMREKVLPLLRVVKTILWEYLLIRQAREARDRIEDAIAIIESAIRHIGG